MGLGDLEQMVLLAVLQAGPDAYGGSVRRELEVRADRTISRGALYVTLDRLESKGMLESRLGESTPGRGGRRKRHVSVTPDGLASLRQARAAWSSLWAGLEEILGDPAP